jgi:predicted RecB family endonuclease
MVFRIATERLRDDRFEDFSEHLRRTLDRFVFELQKERRRLGDGSVEDLRTYEMQVKNTSPALLRVQASSELQNALAGYDSFLAGGLPGHARAMMQRQRQALVVLLRDLEQLSRGYTPSML